MRKYILILFFILFSLNADAKDSQKDSINKLIEKIQKADAKDRRKLINQLKIKLRKLNKENQKKMVMKLKNSLNKDSKNYEKFHKSIDSSHTIYRHIRYPRHRNHR